MPENETKSRSISLDVVDLRAHRVRDVIGLSSEIYYKGIFALAKMSFDDNDDGGYSFSEAVMATLDEGLLDPKVIIFAALIKLQELSESVFREKMHQDVMGMHIQTWDEYLAWTIEEGKRRTMEAEAPITESLDDLIEPDEESDLEDLDYEDEGEDLDEDEKENLEDEAF